MDELRKSYNLCWEEAAKRADVAAGGRDLGILTPLELNRIESEENAALAQLRQQENEIEKKRQDVANELAQQNADKEDTAKELGLRQILLENHTIRSPRQGRIKSCVPAGLFVEDGDKLIEYY
jgi:multidrug resistance efflux pump